MKGTSKSKRKENSKFIQKRGTVQDMSRWTVIDGSRLPLRCGERAYLTWSGCMHRKGKVTKSCPFWLTTIAIRHPSSSGTKQKRAPSLQYGVWTPFWCVANFKWTCMRGAWSWSSICPHGAQPPTETGFLDLFSSRFQGRCTLVVLCVVFSCCFLNPLLLGKNYPLTVIVSEEANGQFNDDASRQHFLLNLDNEVLWYSYCGWDYEELLKSCCWMHWEMKT